jgi:hypothetical protein
MSSVSDTVALASTCTLPVPVAEQRHIAAGSEMKRSAHLKTNENYAVAPYQAMPVTGPVVSSKETRQTGLPVLEPDHTLSPEVGSNCSWAGLQRRPQQLFWQGSSQEDN